MSRSLPFFIIAIGLVMTGVFAANAADPPKNPLSKPAAGPSKPAAPASPAAAPVAPGSFKIGYVDLQRTLNETNAGKAARKKLEADKEKKQKELDAKQKELQNLAEDLEKQ